MIALFSKPKEWEMPIRRLARLLPPAMLMCIVLAGCGAGSSAEPAHDSTKAAPTPTATPTLHSAGVLDGFPLAQGLVADGETRVSTPRREGPGVHIERACGGRAWPGDVVDRRVVEQVGPELAVTRELVVYADPATAANVFDRVARAVTACHRLSATSDRQAMDITLEGDLDASGSRRTVSFAETSSDGRPDGSVYLFTRVGRAVLAVEDSGEWTRASAAGGARDLARTDRAVVTRLCAFRAKGC